ncbi:prepilin peptidase [Candidatus Dojkabacteria bacterium]|nr:prepilin peptidase [Candidatus Dojkabacteria bacterium]
MEVISVWSILAIKLFLLIWVWLIGASVASFLTNLVYRKPQKKPLKGFSVCEKCGKRLSVIELIPVFGYLIIGGKCSKCGYKVPMYYPLVEAFLGFAFVYIVYAAFYYTFNPSLIIVETNLELFRSAVSVFFLIILASVLFYYFMYDLIHEEINEGLTNLLTVGGFIYSLYFVIFEKNLIVLWDIGIAVFVLLGFYLMYKYLKKELMGFGDGRFIALMFLWFPLNFVLGSLWMASLLGGLVVLIIIIVKHKNWRGMYIPYLPILIGGIVLCYFLRFDEYVASVISDLLWLTSLQS